MHTPDDEHVPVKATPTPEAGCSTAKVTYVVSDSSPPPTPCPSRHTLDLLVPIPGPSGSARSQTSKKNYRTIPLSAPGPSAQTSRSRLMVLLDCLASLTPPTTMELLSLMDNCEHGEQRYIDLHDELVDLGIEDAVDLFELPVEILASFGWLRQSSASRLQRFCRDKLLIPLGFVKEDSSSDDTASVVTIASSSDEDGDDAGVMAMSQESQEL